jgi:hypothetical protein
VHRQHMAILRVQQGLESTQPQSSDTTLPGCSECINASVD